VEPVTELHAGFSQPGARPTPWWEARVALDEARTFWLTTVRPEGRPHVTPLIAAWLDGAIYFCTGPEERKARNLARNPACILTTGCNRIDEGLDVVLEGAARRRRDPGRLHALAGTFLDKYGPDWAFEVHDGAFSHDDGGRAIVFELAPMVGFGFRKGEFSQTRWRFAGAGGR
jgi:hypothetical protein